MTKSGHRYWQTKTTLVSIVKLHVLRGILSNPIYCPGDLVIQVVVLRVLY